MEKLIRYNIIQIDDESRHPKGIFIAFAELRDSGELLQESYDQLMSIRKWFNDNLPAPDEVDPRAIFWFKTSAQDCISKVWDLVNFLQDHSYHVEETTCNRPGKIVYEDKYQIAAIPFRDTKFQR